MLYRQMKYFTAVVDCDSFTEAAEQCYISQSAISQQISALEQELGVKLLTKDGRKFRLTPAGEYFYTRSKAILSSIEEARSETVRIGSDSELNLNIGYLAGYEGLALQNTIMEFTKKYPEALVSVFKGTHEELYRALKAGKANLLLSDQRRAFSDEYENFILNQAPAYIDVSPTHVLAQSEFVTAAQLEGFSCILVAEHGEEQTEREYYQDTLGIGKQFIYAASLDEARLMAMTGRGFLPVESVKPHAEPPLVRLEVRRADGSPIVRTYCAFWLKSRANYYIEECALLLRDLFAGEN